MTVNRGKGQNFFAGSGSGKSFAEHNERMRKFRSSHPSELEALRVSRHALINTMWPLLVAGAVGETGGLKLPISAAEWTALAPLRTVVKHRFSPN